MSDDSEYVIQNSESRPLKQELKNFEAKREEMILSFMYEKQN